MAGGDAFPVIPGWSPPDLVRLRCAHLSSVLGTTYRFCAL